MMRRAQSKALYFDQTSGGWRDQPLQGCTPIPTDLSPKLMSLHSIGLVRCELGLPLLNHYGRPIGVIWFKFAEGIVDPSSRDRVHHIALGVGHQAAMVLSSIKASRKQQERIRLDAMRNLINSITHDLGGTVLGAVITEIREATSTKDLNQIKADRLGLLEYLYTYLNVIKAFSAGVDSGHNPMKRVVPNRRHKCNLANLVGEATRIADFLLLAPPCRNLVDQSLEVPVDEDLVTHLLVNVIHNAKKYTKEEVDRLRLPVEVWTMEDEAVVRDTLVRGIWLCVDDQGGEFLNEGEKKQLGYRKGHVHRHGNSTPGVGFGLVFCRLIAEAHGGKMSVADSRCGVGTSCRFFFPFSRGEHGARE